MKRWLSDLWFDLDLWVGKRIIMVGVCASIAFGVYYGYVLGREVEAAEVSKRCGCPVCEVGR